MENLYLLKLFQVCNKEGSENDGGGVLNYDVFDIL
jgi:hypothetical protein